MTTDNIQVPRVRAESSSSPGWTGDITQDMFCANNVTRKNVCVKDTNCRCIKAIVSDSAFSVPPQQLITNDGGIIEIGAEVSTCYVSRV